MGFATSFMRIAEPVGIAKMMEISSASTSTTRDGLFKSCKRSISPPGPSAPASQNFPKSALAKFSFADRTKPHPHRTSKIKAQGFPAYPGLLQQGGMKHDRHERRTPSTILLSNRCSDIQAP